MRKHKLILLLLIPSWLSSVASVLLAVGVLASNYFVDHGSNNALAEGFQGFRSVFNPIYHQLTDGLINNTILNNLPLLLLWAAVGAFVYLIAVRFFSAISNTVSLEHTFSYANVHQDSLVKALLINFGLRLLALLAWFMYCALLFRTILPSHTHANTASQLLINFLLLTVAFHIHVIFMRLITLRVRVFSQVE